LFLWLIKEHLAMSEDIKRSEAVALDDSGTTVCRALRKVQMVGTISGVIGDMSRRRISAIGGIGYNILVAIDGTKES